MKNLEFIPTKVTDKAIHVKFMSEYGMQKTVIARYEDENGIYYFDQQLVKTYIKFQHHLKNDLGISKAAIKKSYLENAEDLPENEIIERGFDIVRDLLNQKKSTYTTDEAMHLVNMYLNSHDACILDHGLEEFSGLAVYQAEQKNERYNKAMEILNNSL